MQEDQGEDIVQALRCVWSLCLHWVWAIPKKAFVWHECSKEGFAGHLGRAEDVGPELHQRAIIDTSTAWILLVKPASRND